ncbi:MAG: FAD-dependent oxidoreductase, partial [Deltaproteobacteria bacterium]|nr:FAD-dependent oxidoreductase [Deltaproteobacteria bacterium]
SPLPSVCGRVCFHPCEQNCNRKEYDEAVSIHTIERFLADYGAKTRLRMSTTPSQGKKVAVVGSGPSGLSCAYHLARMGYEVTIYERLPLIGGILRYGIPEYRLPKEVLDRDIQFILDWGVEIKTNTGLGRDLSFKAVKENFDAVFIGIGGPIEKTLGIPGEEAQEVLSGLRFLSRLNQGDSFRIGQKVAVIGGGNTAIDCARSARRLGAKVQLIYRRTREEMPAVEMEIAAAEQEGVDFIFLASPVKAHLKKGNAIQLECRRMRPGEVQADGRRQSIPSEGLNFFIEVDSVITALGSGVENASLTEAIETGNGLFRIDQEGRTNIPRVYAGGDCVDQPRTVVQAVGAGRRAAFGLDLELGPYKKSQALPDDGIVRFQEINPYYFPVGRKVQEFISPVRERVSNFKEVTRGYSEQMAREEARRCFNCGICTECNTCLTFCPDLALSKEGGHYQIDYNYCKGCGVCVEECPRGVLSMEIEKRMDL